MTTAEEKIKWMESCRGKNHPLKQFRSWLDLYLPQHTSLKAIQVAGTNGKGSSVQWLRLLLESNGYHVGSFTSPHLISHTERLCMDGKPVSLSDWERIFDTWSFLFCQERFTMFEMDLWMAVAWFLETRPDWVLMEAGMGGEKDATTALDYQGQILTNIGMDHMAYLGDTKEKIAQTKAGIFKPSVPVVSTETDPACLSVLQAHAQKTGAVFRSVPSRFLEIPHWPDSLPLYQKPNLAGALFLLETMGVPAELQQTEQAVSRFRWAGRFTVLQKSPLLVADGAHNLHGIEALCAGLQQNSFKKVFFSVLADKQGKEMIGRLMEKIPQVVLVTFESERIADLQNLAEETGLPLISFEQMMEQLPNEKQAALVCGSLYFVGDVLKGWNASKQEIENRK